ncbi:MAG: NUDIX hydrolase [Clostridiaceae bacterium]|nr:NUDIX hydrolase [Clostridiaceae bacterium]
MNYYEKTIKDERKYTGNIINVSRLTVELPNGKVATRDVVSHPGAAVVVPITDDGMLLMVTQYRKPCDMISLELPAGKLDDGEDPEVCAKRELLEETGYLAGNMVKALNIHSTPGFSDELLHMYVATNLIKSEACPDEDEFITCSKHSIPDLINMIKEGKITDAKTIVGIFLADKIKKGEYKIS